MSLTILDSSFHSALWASGNLPPASMRGSDFWHAEENPRCPGAAASGSRLPRNSLTGGDRDDAVGRYGGCAGCTNPSSPSRRVTPWRVMSRPGRAALNDAVTSDARAESLRTARRPQRLGAGSMLLAAERRAAQRERGLSLVASEANRRPPYLSPLVNQRVARHPHRAPLDFCALT